MISIVLCFAFAEWVFVFRGIRKKLFDQGSTQRGAWGSGVGCK